MQIHDSWCDALNALGQQKCNPRLSIANQLDQYGGRIGKNDIIEKFDVGLYTASTDEFSDKLLSAFEDNTFADSI